MRIVKCVAFVASAALIVGCAGRGNVPPQANNYGQGVRMKIADDPTLPLVRAYLKQHPIMPVKSGECDTEQPQAAHSPSMRAQYTNCATPPPTINMQWDYSFMPGNGYIAVSFGPYHNTVAANPGGSTVLNCVVASGKDLLGFAGAVAGALSSSVTQWRSGPNAAALDALLASYAAGEIGAAAFIAGVVALSDAASLVALAAVIGASIWELVDVATCVSEGRATAMAKRRLRVA